jgi:hypothetical protein
LSSRARREQRHWPRQEADQDQRAGDELDDAADPELAADRDLVAEHAEQLRQGVQGEHEAADDAQRGVGLGLEPMEACHGLKL